MNDPLRIGTRGSKLALYQANWVKDAIADRLGRACELVILKTHGDKDTSKPIAELGGVGVFVKELERALLANEVDLAVHSLKDLPTDIPDGLRVAAYPIRVSPHEALLVHPDAVAEGQPIPLIKGARVGTSSLRRMAQLKELRPDLEVASIRGNVPTRVDKARQREVDAVMLAAAGIDRLELDLAGVKRFDLPEGVILPAPGQGALAIEIRDGEPELLELIGRLNDAAAQRTTEAERQLLHGLGAGCSVPLGARAVAVEGDEDRLELRAVYEVDGGEPLRRVCVRAVAPEQAAGLALRVLDPPVHHAAGDRPNLAGKTVLIAREEGPSQSLSQAIESCGGRAVCRAPSETVWHTAAVPETDWVLFASFRGVEALERIVDGALVDALAGRRVGAVGPATARALGARNVPVELLPPKRTGAGLAEALLARVGDARPSVLLPAAENGRPELKDALSEAGCAVTALELYGSKPRPAPSAEELRVDALILASPSGAKATLAGPAPPDDCKLIAIGPTTAKAIEELGHTVAAVATMPNTAGLLNALARALISS